MSLKEIAAGNVMHEETNVIVSPAAPEATKVCSCCKKVKPVSEFSRSRTSNSGLNSRCKPCDTAAVSKWRRENRARYLKYSAASSARYVVTTHGRAITMLRRVQYRAAERDWQCDLDYEWIKAALDVGCCQVTGIPFDLIGKDKGKNASPWAPSIDRIDSNKGYTKDNCRVVVTMLNLALNSFGEDNFRKLSIAYFNAKFPGVINGDVYRSPSAKSKRLLN